MPVRRPAKLTHSRRGESLGPIRKADPTSGATFNVQVVKGKMSGKCLVHACRALTIGLTLMFIGAAMATVGYYTNTHAHELRANGTVTQFRFKNENRGLHLNNLSYLGPIIMGVGGFIVVAACVITFEMRDSAAKVMPARLVVGGQNSKNGTRPVNRGRSMTKAQWEQQLGVFRTSPAEALAERRATTAALVHFSKTFGSPKPVPMRRMSKSDSVPNIFQAVPSEHSREHSPIVEHCMAEYLAEKRHSRQRRRSRPSNSLVQRSTRDNFLHPSTMMQMHKAAISFDESGVMFGRKDSDITCSPQGSVKFDLTPLVINDQEVYRSSRPKPRRSDTAKRHVLSRQKPIEDELTGVHKYHGQRRRSSALSDSPSHRRTRVAGVHRQHSSESRVSADPSPSPEQKFRSQISVCSEPPPILSCQSSIDPVLPEETILDVPKVVAPEEEKKTPSKKLHRSSSTKSYKEKKKLEARKNNEIARLFAIQALKQRLENEHDIEVISERRQKFVPEAETEVFSNSESVTVETCIENKKTATETVINIPTDENETEKEVIK
ncbi:uncharacterized protein LOC134828991 [Culicoides brevitarsis]|uniref:uncharacterized protein LOC134828991 n=1 Tax=Culicoides brevitarsis TaxID=469753 RepID=UPI00307B13C3